MGTFDRACFDRFEAANTAGRHRGPDGWGLVAWDPDTGISRDLANWKSGEVMENPVVFGHRRLAIIDTSSSGAQPMWSGSGNLVVTFNGEIYNHCELREELARGGYEFRSSCDTEVVLAAYEKWGEDCCARFEGMWAFSILDLERKILFCSRDRWGIKPFHYVTRGEEFAFASEIKQLLELGVVGNRYDRETAAGYLIFGAVECGERTFFEGVRKLRQGHNLVYDLTSRTVRKWKYYDPVFEIDQGISHEDAAIRFRSLLDESVSLHLRSDVAVGSCLSGGVDSTSIVLIMRRLLEHEGKGDLQSTFSCHFDEEEANEWEYMQEAFVASGGNNEVVNPSENSFLEEADELIRSQEEPFGSTSIYAQWCVYRLAREKGVKVLLDGQGADEMLSGYVGLSYYFDRELLGKSRYGKLGVERIKRARLNGTKNPVGELARELADQVGPQVLRALLAKVFPKSEVAAATANTSWVNEEKLHQVCETHEYCLNQKVSVYPEEEILNNVLYQLTYLNNLQALLKYADRNSMAFSVESRVPFVHRPLMEFAFSLCAGHKIRDGYTKRVLRDAMEGTLPPTIQWRVSKLGFATPEQCWFKGELGNRIRESLRDPELKHYLDPEKAAAYLDYIVENGVRDSAPWRWYNFVRWRQIYGLS